MNFRNSIPNSLLLSKNDFFVSLTKYFLIVDEIQFSKVLRDQFAFVYAPIMTTSFTFKSYLENRLANGMSVLKTEKWLREDLDKFSKGKSTRSHAQILRRQLIKTKSAKNLLESLSQKDFLSKTRTCESTDYVTNLHAVSGRSQEHLVVENTKEILIEEVKDSEVKRKSVDDLSRSGKSYRQKKLLGQLQEGDLKLIKSKREKLNAFEALSFQKDAHMSERDMILAKKLVKAKSGANNLAGRWLKKKASDETMPTGIEVDDFKASVSLQAGLNKTAERLLVVSNQIPVEQKAVLVAEKVCTLYVKSGQDGTTGNV